MSLLLRRKERHQAAGSCVARETCVEGPGGDQGPGGAGIYRAGTGSAERTAHSLSELSETAVLKDSENLRRTCDHTTVSTFTHNPTTKLAHHKNSKRAIA